MSKLVQLYSDAAHTEKEYPVTTSAAVLHGKETLNEVIENIDSLSVVDGEMCITYDNEHF